MKTWIIGLLSAGVLAASACSSSNPTTTTAAGEGPSATSSGTAKPTGTTAPSTGQGSGTTSTTRATTSGTSGSAVELNTWLVDTVRGPFGTEFARGGKVFCTYNSKGNVWELRASGTDPKFGAIHLLFETPDKPTQARVEITTPGNKDKLGDGNATVSMTQSADNVVSFGIGISYRDTTPTGGEGGTMQVKGACRQEKPPTR